MYDNLIELIQSPDMVCNDAVIATIANMWEYGYEMMYSNYFLAGEVLVNNYAITSVNYCINPNNTIIVNYSIKKFVTRVST